MAISIPGLAVASNTTNTVTVAVPTHVDSDLLYAIIATQDTNTLDTPSGWTKVYAEDQMGWSNGAGRGGELACYSRTASSEPASYIWTTGGTGDDMAGMILSIRGYNVAAPLGDGKSDLDGQNGATMNPPAITVGTAGSLVLIATGWHDDTEDNDVGTPSGYTALTPQPLTNAGLGLKGWYKLNVGAGSEDPGTGAWNIGTIFGIRVVSISPAVEGVTIFGQGDGTQGLGILSTGH